MNFAQLLIFGFAVSIDSFSVGISLNMMDTNFLLCASVFSLSAFMFTYLGLNLGKKINLL
jgi:putative Mn2+ efflux pump MntP